MVLKLQACLRTMRLFTLLPLFAPLLLSACPSSTTRYEHGDGGLDGDLGVDTSRVGRPPRDAAIRYDVYVDPGCDAGALPDASYRECDPYVPRSCPMGQNCYPTVAYPSGACGEEVFATVCRAGGARGMGAHCMGTVDCRGGYACFVTGAGNQCLQLCDLSGGVPTCPRGLICGATDLAEYGACF